LCDPELDCQAGNPPTIIYDNGNFDLVNGYHTGTGWVTDGLIDDYIMPVDATACGFEFVGFTQIESLPELSSVRLRLYDLNNGFDSQFSSTEPLFDTVVSTDDGTLAQVDTGIDGYGYDLVRFIITGVEWNSEPGTYGLHISFPDWQDVLFFWATSTPTNSSQQCMSPWGENYEDGASLCLAENGDFRVRGAVVCGTDEDCNDGVFCNGIEVCDQGTCVGGPALDDGLACTLDICDEDTDTIDHVPQDSRCNDGNACNGVEVCDVNDGCQPGDSPPPVVVYDNGDFDSVNGISTLSWGDTGIVDEFILAGTTPTCGFEFAGLTLASELPALSSVRVRIYDASSGYDTQFSSTEPLLDDTFAIDDGRLAHVDTGSDAFNYDIYRFVVSDAGWSLPAGTYGFHITFPDAADETTFYWATAPQTATADCMNYWGADYETAQDLCISTGPEFENGDFKVVSF
jgi:hypothetical protein